MKCQFERATPVRRLVIIIVVWVVVSKTCYFHPIGCEDAAVICICFCCVVGSTDFHVLMGLVDLSIRSAIGLIVSRVLNSCFRN